MGLVFLTRRGALLTGLLLEPQRAVDALEAEFPHADLGAALEPTGAVFFWTEDVGAEDPIGVATVMMCCV